MAVGDAKIDVGAGSGDTVSGETACDGSVAVGGKSGDDGVIRGEAVCVDGVSIAVVARTVAAGRDVAVGIGIAFDGEGEVGGSVDSDRSCTAVR